LKKKAVDIMVNGIESLRSEFIAKGTNNGEDSISFGDFLLGPQHSIIQTTSGSLISKQSVLNPDFAAMIAEMLIELELDSSDHVAVSYTGSYPGANVALLSALEALRIRASIISSCGSSEYGATHPEFTWIDMETHLFEKKVFSNTSSLASIGGGFDLGTQLGTRGKKVCESSIYNNKIDFLNIDNASENIQKRMNHFTSDKGEISLFINVGGKMIHPFLNIF
jgi:poly-gamma-glutamate system protein